MYKIYVRGLQTVTQDASFCASLLSVDAFHLRVRLAGSEVAPLHP